MSTPRDLQGLFTRRHRRRRGWVVVLGLLAVLAGGVGFYLTRPPRLAAFAGRMLESMFRGTEAHIESAHFTWSGTIELRQLSLRVPTLPGPAGDLFQAEQAVLRIDPWSLATGEAELKQIIVIRPVLSLTQIGPERFNFDVLRDLNQSESSDKSIPRLPRVVLQGGAVRYGEIDPDAGGYRQVGQLDLAGRLDPEEDDDAAYHFELFEHRAGEMEASGARLQGRFDLNGMVVQAELSDFALANPHRNMLPRQVRRWWDEFEPSGAISGIRFHYDEEQGPMAQVRVQDVELTIPQLASEGYKARMTGVSGTFRFTDKQVDVENLVGRIEGVQYRIDGRIDGYSPEAPFTLFLQTQPFRVPEEPRYMLALPSDVQKVFRMFTPVGWMSLSVTARRDAAGAPVDFRGKANILSGRDLVAELRPLRPGETLDPRDPQFSSKGKYSKFPYEVSNVRGMITFNAQAVDIQNLVGDTAGGGSLTIRGNVSPLNNDAVVDITITAVDIPIDQALYDAMKDKHREATEMFFDEPSWERLKAAGRLPDDFKLGGVCNAVVHVQGGTGEGVRPDVTVEIELTRANAVFRHFPYPLRVTRGRLRLSKDQAEFENIGAQGVAGGQLRLDGKIDLPDKASGRKLVPRLGLRGAGFPIDALLLDVLGPPHGPRLAELRLTGNLEIDGTIIRDPEADRIDMDMAVLVSSGSAAPGQGRYKLEDLNGRLTVSLRRAQIEQMTGAHGDGRVELTGAADWTDRTRPSLRLQASATGLRLEDAVIDLASVSGDRNEDLESFWAARRPAGTFDAQATYEASGSERDFQLTLRPASLAFDHRGHRIELAETSGAVTIRPGKAVIEDFQGQFDGGALKLAGTYPLTGWKPTGSDPVTGELAVSLRGPRVTPALLHILPVRLADVASALQLDGAYQLDVPSLRLDDRGLSARGTLNLSGASARIGVGISEFHGGLEFSAATARDSDRLELDLRLHAQTTRVADRPMSDVSLRLQSVPETDMLRMTDLTGQCADGRIGGHGLIAMSTGQYEFHLAIANARLDRLSVRPPGAHDGAAAGRRNGKYTPPPAFTGLLSASLDLEGSWKDPGQLRGRGAIAVRHGQLHTIPLAMGLLNVSHLQLPVATQFESAALAYYMLHDRVVFESIEMTAPSMVLVGRGQMQVPDQRLDITLTTSNPNGLRLGPLSQLIDKVRNQIVTLRIGGTLDRPETRVQQLNGLSEAWEDVFGPRARPSANADDPR